MSESSSVALQRVRFPLRFRTLIVEQVQDLTPHMRRLVLAGEEMEGFRSLGFDDHVKVFPPLEGRAQVLPSVDEDNNPVWTGPTPVGRDYTPRGYQEGADRLVLDFATGHGGPVTQWVEQVRVGDEVGLGGPRGSFLVPPGHERQVLIGDDTAIPAILNRLEALSEGVKAVAVIEVEGPQDEHPVHSGAEVEVVWIHRQEVDQAPGAGLMQAAVKAVTEMEGPDIFVWGAMEAAVARALRPALLAARPDLNPKLVRISSYWKRDEEDVLEVVSAGADD